MAQLYVKKFDMINPFVVAASPATQGAINVLKTAKMRPGAITMRNFGHGAGGGSFAAKRLYTAEVRYTTAMQQVLPCPILSTRLKNTARK